MTFTPNQKRILKRLQSGEHLVLNRNKWTISGEKVHAKTARSLWIYLDCKPEGRYELVGLGKQIAI